MRLMVYAIIFFRHSCDSLFCALVYGTDACLAGKFMVISSIMAIDKLGKNLLRLDVVIS